WSPPSRSRRRPAASPRRSGRSQDDLRSGAGYAREARHDREHALARAEEDVLLEPRWPVGACVQRLERARVGARNQLGGDRGIRAVAVEERDDPAGAVRVVEGERTLEACAED